MGLGWIIYLGKLGTYLKMHGRASVSCLRSAFRSLQRHSRPRLSKRSLVDGPELFYGAITRILFIFPVLRRQSTLHHGWGACNALGFLYKSSRLYRGVESGQPLQWHLPRPLLRPSRPGIPAMGLLCVANTPLSFVLSLKPVSRSGHLRGVFFSWLRNSTDH